MYRPGSSQVGLQTLLVLVALGVLLGSGLFVYDNYINVEPTPLPTQVAAQPTAVPSAPVLPTTAPTPDSPLAQRGPSSGAEVFIPSAGIYAPVITAYLRNNTWDVAHLGTNVGYLQGTAWMDEPGNVVLSGHVELADGRQGIFATLDTVKAGDTVYLTEDGEQAVYEVTEVKTVAPDDLSVVYPTPAERLTLITCSDYNFISNKYDTRLVVVADRVS